MGGPIQGAEKRKTAKKVATLAMTYDVENQPGFSPGSCLGRLLRNFTRVAESGCGKRIFLHRWFGDGDELELHAN
jgi:hypothetical protein